MSERQKRYNRRQTEAAADIGEIPAVVNPARRAACEKDLEKHLVTYFPRTTGLSPFSDEHKRAIKRIQRCGLEGGKFGNAFPRGFAKTTITENSVIWVLINGHRKFAALFGATSDNAVEMIESIKSELAENDLLMEDYPEVCHAIRMLEGKPQRCASQTHTVFGPCDECGATGHILQEKKSGPPVEKECPACKGTKLRGDPQLTHIAWTADQIVLPSIRLPWDFLLTDDEKQQGSESLAYGKVSAAAGASKYSPSPASEGVATTRGITAGARGMKYKRSDGTQQRPDFVGIDDPQTDESAASLSQVKKRMNVIKKSLLKLGGHRGQIAVVMNATVIERGDLVDQFLDPKLNPSWQSERIKMVRRWADEHIDKRIKTATGDRRGLWADYKEFRETYDAEDVEAQKEAHRKATAFYKKNRKAMDKGADVTWVHCFDEETELSAIQHAYNMLIDDGPEVFASECQNEPLVPEEDKYLLTDDQIVKRANGMPRGVVPLACSWLACHIDVQKESLWYWILGGTADFTTHLVDDGIWPRQTRKVYSKKELSVPLSVAYPKMGTMAAIAAALTDLTAYLESRDFIREGDNVSMRLDKGCVDPRWGESTVTVKKFLRGKGGIWLAAEGQYIGPGERPMSSYETKPNEVVGNHWLSKTTASGKVLKVDTNFYKTTVHRALRTPIGDRGAMTLYGKPEDHEVTANQIAAEHPHLMAAKGREVEVWKLLPGRDNERLDNAVGCMALLSNLGCDLLSGQVKDTRRKRVRFSQLQRREVQ